MASRNWNIHSRGSKKDLKNYGVVSCYRVLKELRPKEVSLNFLYSLEASVRNIDWRELHPEVKNSLKKQVSKQFSKQSKNYSF